MLLSNCLTVKRMKRLLVLFLHLGTLLVNAEEEEKFRLANGTSLFNGRIEVYSDGEWRTIPDISFGDTEAVVLCRSLGYSGGIAHRYGYYGKGSGNIWKNYVTCTGDEYSLSQCTLRKNCKLYLDCDHMYDVGVECNGTVNLRLVDGTDEYSGAVEVFYNRTWGTICNNNGVGHANALFICRLLGFSGGTIFKTIVERKINDPRPIWLSDVICDWSDYSLMMCEFRGWGVHNCTHEDDLVIKCDLPTGCTDCIHKYSCDAVADKCTCKRGWKGNHCDHDVDECRDPGVYYCPDNTTCQNTNGSYYCQQKFLGDETDVKDGMTIVYISTAMGIIILAQFVAIAAMVRSKMCGVRTRESRYTRFIEPTSDDNTNNSEVVNTDTRIIGTASLIRRSEPVESSEVMESSATGNNAFAEARDYSHTHVKVVD